LKALSERIRWFSLASSNASVFIGKAVAILLRSG
jgi:hypothetical protein